MACNKSENIALNVPKALKAINDNVMKKVRTLRYLGNGFTNDLKTPKHFLHLRISPASPEWEDLTNFSTYKLI